MRQEAEANADQDKARREVVDLKNQADAAVYEIEKQLKEHGDKLAEADRKAIEEAKEELKQAAESEDKGRLESALQNLQQRAQKLGEAMYAQEQQAGAAPPPGADGQDGGASGGSSQDDEPVDADFEVKT